MRIITFIPLLFFQCQVGRYETIYPATVAILVDSKTKSIKKEEIIEPGSYYVGKGESFVIFNLIGDTLAINGNALTKDTVQIQFRFELVYTYQKNSIIDFYKQYGFKYTEVIIEPEIKKVIRIYLGNFEKKDLQRFDVANVSPLARDALDSMKLIYISVNDFNLTTVGKSQ